LSIVLIQNTMKTHRKNKLITQKQQAILVMSMATISLGIAAGLSTQKAIANTSSGNLQNITQPFGNAQLIGSSERSDHSQSSQDIPHAVRQALHQQLQQRYGDVNFEINNITKTHKQWSDACLGLATSRQMCAQVITPGYKFQITGQLGQEQPIKALWVFHTDENFNQVRLNEQASQLTDPAELNRDQPELPCAIEQKLNQKLQQRYADSHFKITEVQQTSQQWPNGCLGLAEPDEICTQAIVPGYKVIVKGEFDAAEPIEAVWVFHTDQDFNHIRLNQKASQLPNPEKVPKG